MRITKIEIKNFRAFYGQPYQIDLYKAEKNLLIYGENGSGKSSLYLALKYFLESSEDDSYQFENYQNIFIEDAGYIKLHLRADRRSNAQTYEWSQSVKKTNDPLFIEASKSKGFLDYKALLETHYVHRESGIVNVFDLLVKNLLANTVSALTGRSLADDWEDIQPPFPRRNATNQVAILEEQIENFNLELAGRLTELQTKASEILGKFGYDIAIDLDFQKGITYNRDNKALEGQKILLKVKFFDKDIPPYHSFLNEAKLSAIAIAIYFSSILIQPESDLKILALDDVLIGLDMSNRLPVIDILEEYFSDYQIFFLTYDRTWYEIVRQRTEESKWKYAEFYFRKTPENEIPVYEEDRAYLEKAKEYFADNDYKACAIYLRTAFEEAIKKFCDKKRLPVRYSEDPKKLTSEDFWTVIKSGAFLQNSLINEIELYRKIILNPLSHATIVNIIKKEISEAIEAVENLEEELKKL